ncbi:MAG: hypothetical protein AB7W16_01425 [Candidatus Obscuribacterales bacterium]
MKSLGDIYRELASMEPFLQALGDDEILSSTRLALAEPDGNQKMAAVKAVLEMLRERLDRRGDVGSNEKMRLLVMLNSIKRDDLHKSSTTIDNIVEELEGRHARVEVIAPGGEDRPFARFKERFPLAFWRFVDWSRVPDCFVKQVRDPEEIKAIFQSLCRENSILDGEVFITTSFVEPSLRMSLTDLLACADVLARYGTDLLFIIDDADWVFEIYHEGDIGFGRAPL